jgi:G1/S-specific cyclin PLC1
MVVFMSETDLASFMCKLPLSSRMIDYIAQQAMQVVPNMAESDPNTPPQNHDSFPPVSYYIKSVVARSRVQIPTFMPTLVTSLVYLSRLQSRLPPEAKAVPSTAHRIFLATLILADKNLHDNAQWNWQWVQHSIVPGYESVSFPIAEINLMERQLLYLLDWDVRVRPQDLYRQLDLLLNSCIQQPLG